MAARASSARARVTAVPDSTLLRLFEAKGTAAGATTPRTNTVAVQTTAVMSDVALLEHLVGTTNDIGVVTVQHARDAARYRLREAQVLSSLLQEESYQRQCIAQNGEDSLATLARALSLSLNTLATLRNAAEKRRAVSMIGQCDFLPTAAESMHGRMSLISPTVSPTHAAAANRSGGIFPLTTPAKRTSSGHSNPSQARQGLIPEASLTRGKTSDADEENLEKLKNRIDILESRVRSAARSNSEVAEISRPFSFRWATKGRGDASTLARVSPTQQAEAIAMQEESSRQSLMDDERVRRENVLLGREKGLFEAKLRKAVRVMVHAPFQSYRPKIPIQNSLAGEEYLRRWLLVETLQHYEDCLTLLQRHENDIRNAIEDESDGFYASVESVCFLPFYRHRCSRLERELSIQRAASNEQRKKADSLYAMLQLKVIVDQEERQRDVLYRSAMESFPWLKELHFELAQVRGVHALARRLETQLTRQGLRYQQELQFLLSRVPKHGVVHPNAAILTEHDAVALQLSPVPPPSRAQNESSVASTRHSLAQRRAVPQSSTAASKADEARYWAGF